MTELSAAERRRWREQLEEYAEEGHKSIGCAWRELERMVTGDHPATAEQPQRAPVAVAKLRLLPHLQ
jgi:hypothetical protein